MNDKNDRIQKAIEKERKERKKIQYIEREEFITKNVVIGISLGILGFIAGTCTMFLANATKTISEIPEWLEAITYMTGLAVMFLGLTAIVLCLNKETKMYEVKEL